MRYILNFDNNKIKEINLNGIESFKKAKEENKYKEIKTSQKPVRLVLDTDDLLILRFIYTIGNEPKTIRDRSDKNFFWVKLASLLEEYEGLLFMSKTALNVRLNKYVEMRLIERKCIKNQDGSFSFFKLTGINDLIYIPKKKIKEGHNKKEKVTVEVLEGQIAVEEVIVETIEDMLMKETGASMLKVKKQQICFHMQGKL